MFKFNPFTGNLDEVNPAGAAPSGDSLLRTVMKVADEARSLATDAEVPDTELVLSVVSGKKYKIRGMMHFTVGAGAVGVGWGLNTPTYSFFNWVSYDYRTALDQISRSAISIANGGTYYIYSAENWHVIEGTIIVTANGNISVGYRQDTSHADPVTGKKGSTLTLEEIP